MKILIYNLKDILNNFKLMFNFELFLKHFKYQITVSKSLIRNKKNINNLLNLKPTRFIF
jgi:hypothetical protein